MAKLIILTLGSLQITKANTPLSGFLSDKVRALLAYLAVEQKRPLRRETLAALLWPERPERKARANLRRALANLRQVIDDENGRYLHITRQTLQFNAASAAWVDAVQFEHLLGEGEPTLAQMEEAAALVNGRFLAGFSINDSIAFEEWALLKREEIQRQLLHSLNRLTAYYESHHQSETAVQYAWQQVRLEPWYEPGQRQLLRLLSHTQQRAAALSHYEQFEQELWAELGIMPEPATRRLYEAIRDGQMETETAVTRRLPSFLAEPRTMATAPFVARERELAQLAGYWQTAVAGRGQVAFVTGEAGSGKTLLVQNFAQQAQRQAPTVIPLFGECQAHIGQGSPYLPFRMLLARAVGDIESLWQSGYLNREQAKHLWMLRETAVKLLQEEAPDLLSVLIDPAILPEDVRVTAVANTPSQAILFQQLTHFLQKFSQYGPLLLLLDDLQWADSGSIDLLFYLRRQIVGYPILIIGTYRPEEVIEHQPETGQRHPLAHFVHELARDFGEMEVALNEADGRAFVDAWLDTEANRLDETFRQTVYGHTRGQALFTVELVAGLREQGDLFRDEAGYWQVRETVSWAQMPAKAEAIIAERIGRLPAPLRHLLTTASVQGETFVAEVVAKVMDRSPLEIIRSLSGALARRHQLVRAQGRQQIGAQSISHYHFRHNLFQWYVYGRLDPIERAYLHQMTGELLEGWYETAGTDMMTVAAQLAYHFSQAQIINKAIHYHQLAGQQALRLSAHAEAIGHYRQGLTLLATQPETTAQIQQEIDIQLALSWALLAIQGYASPEVKQVYDRALALCRQVEATLELVTTFYGLSSYYMVRGQYDTALSIGQQMLTICRQKKANDVYKMQAHLLTGLPLFFMGHNQEALDHFEAVIALYDPLQHQPQAHVFGQDLGISSMIWKGHVLLHMGYLKEAQNSLQQALSWSEELNHPYTHAFALFLAGCTPHWYFHNFEQEHEYAQRTLEAAQKGDFIYMAISAPFYLGQAAALIALRRKGRSASKKVAEGIALMKEAMAKETGIGSRGGRSSRWTLLADIYGQTGQLEEAWVALQQGEMEIADNNERYFEAEWWRVKGELYLQEEDEAQAEICWRQAIVTARSQKAKLLELKATTDLCRLWQRQGRNVLAKEHLAEICDWFGDNGEGWDLDEARILLMALGQTAVETNL